MAALRRSELVAVDVVDIKVQPEGRRIVIRPSKPDRGVVQPSGSSVLCKYVLDTLSDHCLN